MKTKIMASILTLTLTQSVFAKGFWENTKEVLKDYGVPCALSLGVSYLLVKENKAGVGLAGCAGAGVVKYYHKKDLAEMDKRISDNEKMMDMRIKSMQNELRAEMKKEMLAGSQEDLVLDIKENVYKEINESLKADKEFVAQMLTKIKVEFDAYKDIVDQVLAEKLLEYRKEISKEIEIALIEGPFVPMLEEKLNMQMQENQKTLFMSERKKLIEDCVEGTLKEVVLKRVGVPKE